ncbi:MAG TPA: hypothetical protein VLT86_08225 [Vicinamibacterales bacterium]|nr:hypothetical protein [Vicinamibacterales bacterium]
MRARTILASLLLVAASLVALAQTPTPTPTPAKPINIAGKWAMTLDLSIGQATPALDLKQDGEKVTGTYTGRYGTFPLQGTLKGRALEFSFQMNAEGQDVTMSFSGEVAVDGESMKGTATIEGLGDATWTAKRDKGSS